MKRRKFIQNSLAAGLGATAFGSFATFNHKMSTLSSPSFTPPFLSYPLLSGLYTKPFKAENSIRMTLLQKRENSVLKELNMSASFTPI